MKTRITRPRNRNEEEEKWREAQLSDDTGTIRKWLRLAKELFDQDKDKDNDPTPSAA